MAFVFSKGKKNRRGIGFLDGANGPKQRSVSPFVPNNNGSVVDQYLTEGGSYSPTRMLGQLPANSGTRRTGEMGRAKKLNGTNQAVRVSDNPAFDWSNALTVSIWAKNDNSSLAGTVSFIGKYDSALNRRELAFGLNTSSQVQLLFGSSGGSTGNIWRSNSSYAPDELANYAFTYDAGTLKVFVNGVEIDGIVTNGSIPATLVNQTADIIIGGHLSNNSLVAPWDGQLFDARIYSSVLSASEIQSIYQDSANNIQFSGKTLVAHYKLDEQSGTTCFDSSGNSLHGTIENPVDNESTQDIVSFQNQVGYNKRMYFGGSQYVAVSGMAASEDYFGACTISAKIFINSPSVTNIICSLSDSSYRIYLAGGTWRVNSTNTGINATLGYNEFSFSFNSSGDAVSFVLNGIQVWVGSASAGVATDSIFRIGAQKSLSANFSGIIWDFSITGSSVKNFSLNGYGNTNADWIDTTGTVDGSDISVNGSPSNIYLPRDESNPSNDVLENPLTYTGRRPNDFKINDSNCLKLNGTNQAVRVGDDPAFDWSNALTVSVWAKNNTSGLPASEIIISKYDTGSNKREWQLGFDENEKIIVAFGDPSDGTFEGNYFSDSAVTINIWNHLCFTFNAGSVLVYVNGYSIPISIESGTIPVSLYNGDADLNIGSSLSSGSLSVLWDGQLFDPRIYNRVLSASEIQSIYDDFRNLIDDPNLVCGYSCSEGAGTTIHDYGPNALHGTIENPVDNNATQDLVPWNSLVGCSKRMYFDGSSLISLGNKLDISDKTSAFRIKFTLIIPSALNDFTYFVGKGLRPSVAGYTVRNGSSGNREYLSLFVSDSANSDESRSSVAVFTSAGKYEIDITYNGDRTVTAIVNGSSVEMSDIAESNFANFTNFSNTENFSIGGRDFDSGGMLDGIISNVEIYISGVLKYKSDIYGNTNADCVDLSGNDNNGTVVGSPAPIYLPATAAGLDPFGNALTDPFIDGKFNRSESTIDFNPDSTPEMGAVQLNPNVYQTAQQVFTAAQADTITELRFKFRSTDTSLALFNDGATTPYLLFIESGSSSTDLSTNSDSPTITIDGSTDWGSTRGDLYNTLCDGENHDVLISGISFSGDWLTNGLYINSYSGYLWDSSTYIWDISSSDLIPASTIYDHSVAVPSSYSFGDELGEDGFISKTVEFEDSSWGAIFDGSSYANVGNSGKLRITTEPFEIEATIKTTGTGAYDIVSKYSSTGDQRSYRFYISNGDLFFSTSDDGDGTGVLTLIGSVAVNDGSWHTVRAVRETASSTTVKLYIDGVEDTGTAGSVDSAFFDSSAPFVIGANNLDGTPSGEFDGYMRDVKVTVNDILVAHWELAKDTRDVYTNNFHGANTGITFVAPKREHSFVVNNGVGFKREDQQLKNYNKSHLFL